MSSTQVKGLLKVAKTAIERNDPSSALEVVEEILELDERNYFAFIFQGKAWLLLNDVEKSVAAFRKATEIDTENLLGWKGYFQAARLQNDYDLFFSVVSNVLRVEEDNGVAKSETIRSMQIYLDSNNLRSNIDLEERYLRAIVPGGDLSESIGHALGKPEENLHKLIELVKKRESEEISVKVSKQKMKFSRVLTFEQRDQLNKLSWEIVQKYNLSALYSKILDICNDDELRHAYQEEYLKYKYKLLSWAPEKEALLAEVKDLVDGFVVIKNPSFFCWTLYFDFMDLQDFDKLKKEDIVFVLKNFASEGLGVLFNAFILSDLSSFRRDEILESIKQEKSKTSTKQEKVKQPFVEATEEEFEIRESESKPQADKNRSLYPGEILALMLEGYNSCPNSVFASRLICRYYVHLHEYSGASEKCKEAIKLLADLQRNIGLNLPNSKEDLLCSLALVYTHDEAPKNYTKALQLFDKILESNETNSKAKVGKALIMVQRNKLPDAVELLQSALSEDPSDLQASLELNWCKVKLGSIEEGREGLLRSLSSVEGMDMNSCNVRAITNWRIAESYLIESESESNIDNAYTHLIQSLKESQTHAPSYTLLGIVYEKYKDDHNRAKKCFYKAFELDVGEIQAARYLVEDLTDKNEWDIAEVLCKRIILNGKSRGVLLATASHNADTSWPYRVLGCAALNRQDDGKAIEWFQTALRMASMDSECWVGLGEAYFNCGRLDAANKVFCHALSMEPESWVVKYMLGQVLCEMQEFSQGILYLKDAFNTRPNEEAILNALYEANLAYTQYLLSGNFVGRAFESVRETIKYISLAVEVNKLSQNLWRAVGECLRIFSLIKKYEREVPMLTLEQIFSEVDLTATDNTILEQINSKDKICEVKNAVAMYDSGDRTEAILYMTVLAAKAALKQLPKRSHRKQRSIAAYNLGLAEFEYSRHSSSSTMEKYSIICFREAIKLESTNYIFWVALGNAYVSDEPLLAQHCYIKAMSLSNDSDIWNNLATLYLNHHEFDLAQQAFLRSQSTAPEKSQAWMGHALTLQAKGDDVEASKLFTHAYVLSNGRSPLAQILYGLSVVDKWFKDPDQKSDPRDIRTSQELSVANFAMLSYLTVASNDELGLQIAVNISERCNLYDAGFDLGKSLMEIRQNKLHTSRSDQNLRALAQIQTQMARICLGLGNELSAFENAQAALDTLANLGDVRQDDQDILSSRVVVGLCHFMCGEFDQALEQLKHILAHHSKSPRLVTLTAQILYAFGQEDTIQAAIDQLLAFTEENGSSLIVLLTLGAIAVVQNLDDFLAAVKDEFRGIALQDYLGDQVKMIPKLLIEINKKLSLNSDRIWQRYSVLFPQDYNVWSHLNNHFALQISSLDDSRVTSYDMSNILLQAGKLRHLQRSLVLYPANPSALSALQQC